MKKLFYFAFMAMLCCGFVACSDDDDNGGDAGDIQSALIGTWEVEKEYWVYEDEWDYVFGQGVFRQVFTFEANGVGSEWGCEWDSAGNAYEWRDKLKYSLHDTTISISFYDIEYDEYFYEDWTIKKLSDNELVVRVVDEEGDTYDKYMRRR